MKIKTVIFALILLLIAGSVRADVYVGRNENGTISLTDTPSDTSYRLLLESKLPEDYEVPSGEELEEIVSAASSDFGPPEPLIYAVIRVESNSDSTAVSSRGAKGLMQLMPATARQLGVKDIYAPRENIRAGTRYLQKMINRFDGDLELALAAYNAGPGRVKEYDGVPPFKETQKFIERVELAWDEFKNKDDTIYTYRDEDGIINITNIH
ncbi:MAG: lytic transglycosylase domain-containing protein [bacterium]